MDLRGLCFNFFSRNHRAAACRSHPRCFKCKEIGHRFYNSPLHGRVSGGHVNHSPRISVWKHITPLPTVVADPSVLPIMVAPSDVAESDATAVFRGSDVYGDSVSLAGQPSENPHRHDRRRYRPRHRRRATGKCGSASPKPMVRDDGISPASGPPDIIDWSDRLEQASLDMRRAIIVTVFGDHLPLTHDEIRANGDSVRSGSNNHHG